jgi:SulP family sulfate permease
LELLEQMRRLFDLASRRQRRDYSYSTIVGLPVKVGLYTAFVPPIIYALLGTSRPLSVSTTTTLAILTVTEFGQVVVSDPASLVRTGATLTLLVGAILVLASLLRLGFVANFISEPVLVGFKAGIGLVIVFDQIPEIPEIHFARGTFIDNLLSLFHSVPVHIATSWDETRYISILS